MQSPSDSESLPQQSGTTLTDHTKVTSPFLPGTKIQYAYNSTSLSWLKECPRKYQYKMIDGWQKEEENVHLRFGIEYHWALQAYEQSTAVGISHEDSLHDVVRELLIRTADWRTEHKYKNRNFLIRTVVWYLDQFSSDPAITVIKADGKPAVEESFRFELDWGPGTNNYSDPNTVMGEFRQPYLLCGHLDRVVSFNDDLFVMDHKTTTRTPSDWYFKQFEPNNQMTLYTLAGQVIFNAPIKGVIIDSCQIMIEGSRFVRSFTYRTKDQIDEWLGDLKVLLAKAEEYATLGYWPMNDTACVMCEFREICSKSPQVREKFLASEFVKGEPLNPLSIR
jgi:PD-(D/E)XK nuclease superfamily